MADLIKPRSLARPAPSVAMDMLTARCHTNHSSFDAINRLVQVWQNWLGQPTKALHRVACLSPQGCGQRPIGAGRVWVETINTLTAFGWDRAHGSAGGAGAGGPTDEGTESNGILRGPNEAEFAQVQNLGPDNESGAR
jgi:hypothetical protein